MTTPGRILHLSGKLKHEGAGCSATYGLTKGTTVTVLVLGSTVGRRPDEDEAAAMLRGGAKALATAVADFQASLQPRT